MKYNVIISRTYATELVVDAENTIEVHDWLDDNKETINYQELEQCNIIVEDTNIELVSPSPNEVSELQDLVQHINLKLQQYSHVEDFIPNDLYKALEQMLGHDIED
jgi:hypothetical protein